MQFKKKLTRYFTDSVLTRRPELIQIAEEIEKIIDHPARIETQPDGRIKLWGMVQNKKWLRVILDGDQIHNAFFDRNFKL